MSSAGGFFLVHPLLPWITIWTRNFLGKRGKSEAFHGLYNLWSYSSFVKFNGISFGRATTLNSRVTGKWSFPNSSIVNAYCGVFYCTNHQTKQPPLQIIGCVAISKVCLSPLFATICLILPSYRTLPTRIVILVGVFWKSEYHQQNPRPDR